MARPVRTRRSESVDLRRYAGPARFCGFALTIGGFFMVAVGVYNFSASFSNPQGGSDLFWLAFVGMLVLVGGITLLRFGFFGPAARYVADEASPAVKEIAGAVARGWRDATSTPSGIRCPHCGEENGVDARFCDSCGESLTSKHVCPGCGAEQPPDARFCSACGTKLV